MDADTATLTQADQTYLKMFEASIAVPGFTAALNAGGAARLTICPQCHVDDFTHVKGCKIAPLCDALEEQYDNAS